MSEKKKVVHRIMPYAAFEVEEIESWLASMAAQGLHLEKNGYFCGVVTFLKADPCSARYRLMARPESKERLTDTEMEPDDVLLETAEYFSWEYVARIEHFFVYRTANPNAREFMTDTEVQALALESVKRRERSSLLGFLLSLGILLVFNLRFQPLLAVLLLGSPLTFVLFIMIFGTLLQHLNFLIKMRRLQSKIRSGGEERKATGRMRRTQIARLMFDVVCLILIAVLGFLRWSEAQKQPLSTVADLPFAVFSELTPKDTVSEKTILEGEKFNYVEQLSDVLAPRIVEYSESTAITLSDGSTVEGLYVVYYVETRHPWLAAEIAREMMQEAKSREVEILEAPQIDGMAIHAAVLDSRAEQIIFSRGNVAVRALLLSYEENALPLDVWTGRLADSIGRFDKSYEMKN